MSPARRSISPALCSTSCCMRSGTRCGVRSGRSGSTCASMGRFCKFRGMTRRSSCSISSRFRRRNAKFAATRPRAASRAGTLDCKSPVLVSAHRDRHSPLAASWRWRGRRQGISEHVYGDLPYLRPLAKATRRKGRTFVGGQSSIPHLVSTRPLDSRYSPQ